MRIIGLPGRTNRAAVVEHAAADCRPVGRAGLRVGLRRPYGASVRQMHDGHQHHPASADRVQGNRHRNAKCRGGGGTVARSAGARESSPWGRSGPATPVTANRNRREQREERGRKALGRGQSGIRMVPARLNARCVMVATECVATGADWMAGATTWGQMMRRIRNPQGPKRADEIRREPGGPNPRTNRFK